MLDVVNSFHKTPVYAVAPAAGPGPSPDDEFDDAEDIEMAADAAAAGGDAARAARERR